MACNLKRACHDAAQLFKYKQFFKHLSRELAENLSLKGNKNHLLGSTNLFVKTAQFT